MTMVLSTVMLRAMALTMTMTMPMTPMMAVIADLAKAGFSVVHLRSGGGLLRVSLMSALMPSESSDCPLACLVMTADFYRLKLALTEVPNSNL